MTKQPVETQYLTLDKLRSLLHPPRPFYLVAVNDTLQRGELAEIQALIQGAKEVKAQHGSLDGLITKLEAAAKKAQA
jgi:hypothetical protein